MNQESRTKNNSAKSALLSVIMSGNGNLEVTPDEWIPTVKHFVNSFKVW